MLCTYKYNPFNGSLIQSTLADGTTTGTVYDEYGRVTSSSMNDQVINEYVYDNDGQVARKRDVLGDQTTVFDYNDSGLVVRASVYSGDSVSSGDLESRMQYTYTKGGQVGGLSYQEKDGDIRTYTYTYAADTRPTKSEHPDGSTTQWSYDTLRRHTQAVFTPKSGAAVAKKLYTTLEYQKTYQNINGATYKTATNLISKYTNKFGAGGTAIQSQFDYTYDTWGNIIRITDLDENARKYTYNDYSELVSAEETYSDGSTVNYSYTYDLGGNILTETVNDTVNRYVYDSVWKDKLVSYNGKAITYDQFGCPLNYMGATMTWDVNGNLISVKDNADSISYTYLSDGTRSSKTVNGKTTEYHYNNGMLLSQTTGDETIRYYYDCAGKVSSISYQKGTNAEVGYFYARNAHGDVIAIYRSSDSQLIGTYEYDLWGKTVSIKEASVGIDTNGILEKNPIRYRSYYFDNETGFYNLNARYYDPEIRRFISADSLSVLMIATTSIGCKNLFNYCENNPVNGKDSSGGVVESPFDIATLVISVVEVCVNPADPWAWLGLAGDAVDLIPFVTGVGEAVKGAKCVAKYGDETWDVAVCWFKSLDKADDAAEEATTVVAKVTKKGKAASGGLDDNAVVVRGGMSTPENLLSNQAKDVRGHISANAANGVDLKGLATTPEPFKNGKISTTTVGDIRGIGMDVIPDPTKSNPYHVSIVPQNVPMSPEEASNLSNLFVQQPNLWRPQ